MPEPELRVLVVENQNLCPAFYRVVSAQNEILQFGIVYLDPCFPVTLRNLIDTVDVKYGPAVGLRRDPARCLR